MKEYQWQNCPPNVRRQAELITNYLHDYLGSALVGVYIHGSIALGSFLPARSDLDLLIVVDRMLTAKERFKLMIAFLSLHRQPVHVEASIVRKSDMDNWTFPTPYEFHFSEHWRKRFEAMEAREDDSFWQFEDKATDSDLACHVKLARQAGIALYGPEPCDILPEVPHDDFWQSIRADADYYAKHSGDLENAGILSLLRIWAYKELGEILSKTDACRWAEGALPEELRHIAVNAMNEYAMNVVPARYNQSELLAFKTYLLNRIDAAVSVGWTGVQLPSPPPTTSTTA
ncbi:aminoglycoside adenylyltransferase domain-containing protein [Paenibacillus sp. MY03]|uniref:aminoglycoside adenylyltransferase domain-containing protein n=1 Tax=Paenibacillus sp. MY03 TaxID=302980 RepID=UPI0015C5D35E|nr:aminoglycoside adenylyltransferase domain-containing protein [Paenibacillus sp. MY03]